MLCANGYLEKIPLFLTEIKTNISSVSPILVVNNQINRFNFHLVFTENSSWNVALIRT